MKLEQKIEDMNQKIDAIIKYFGISSKPQRNVIELRKEASRLIEKIKKPK